jgi:hypothetical protein
LVESPRTATFTSDDLERLVEDLERPSDMPTKSFTFRRKPRSTSSDSRSRSFGNTVQLASEYARRLGAVLAAVKIAPFGDGLSLVRELDDPRVPGRGYPGLQTPSPGTAGTRLRSNGMG